MVRNITNSRATGSAAAFFILVLAVMVSANDCGGLKGGVKVGCDCGDTVVRKTELRSVDPIIAKVCPPGDGLTINPGMELDVRDHTLQGSGTGSGLILSDGVIVKRGTITGFQFGISGNVNNSTIETMQVVANGDDGIAITGDYNLISKNVAGNLDHGNGRYGISMVGSFNQVVENEAYDNADDGLHIEGDTNLIKKNTAGDLNLGNGGNGIAVVGSFNQVAENKAYGNADDGIDVEGNNNLIKKNLVGDRDKGNGDDGIDVVGAGNVVQENLVFGNVNNGIHSSGGTAENPNSLKKNVVGELYKGNGGNGILIENDVGNGTLEPVEVQENTIKYNTLAGIFIAADATGHELKKTSTTQNGGNEYDVSAGNVDGGENRANGALCALPGVCP